MSVIAKAIAARQSAIFGQASRSPTALVVIAIGLNVKKPTKIRYAEVSDGQSRTAKLEWLSQLTRNSPDWIDITPNAKSEWLNQSSDEWPRYTGLADPKDRYSKEPTTIFRNPTAGQQTKNDELMYAETREKLRTNLQSCIDYLDKVALKVRTTGRKNLSEQKIREIARAIGPEPTGFKWHTELTKLAQRKAQPRLRDVDLRTVDCRPFWNRETWHVADWIPRRFGQPKVCPTHMDDPALEARIPDLWKRLNTPEDRRKRGRRAAELDNQRRGSERERIKQRMGDPKNGGPALDICRAELSLDTGTTRKSRPTTTSRLMAATRSAQRTRFFSPNQTTNSAGGS